MDVVMVRSLISFVVIVCVLVVIDSDMKFLDYKHLGIAGFCNAQEMDDNSVEQMWIRCISDYLHNEDAYKPQLVKYQSLSGWSSFPRRSLRDKKLRHQISPASVPSSAPFPSPVLSPSSASSPSPASSPMAPAHRAPASSPSLNFESPSVSPKQESLLKNVLPLPIVHPPPIKPHIIPPMPTTPPPMPTSPPPRPPDFGPDPSKNDHEDKKNIVSAVAGGTVAAVTLVALVLVCYVRKRHKGGQELEQTDGRDRHVLNLSSSEHISAGAKQMSQSNENHLSDLKTSSTVNNSPLVKPDIQSSSATGTETETQASEAAGKSASPLPPPPPKPNAPGPPPPPKVGHPPAPPKQHNRGRSSGGETGSESGASKAKLKPFFWDKVNASPNRTMVWHEIKSGSFQVNEEKMESLFGYSTSDKNQNERRKDLSPFDSTPQYIQIIDARKAQNLAILLKALNLTTEEVCDALKEGNELPSEFVQTLLKMAPTEDEELKLRLFTGDISELSPADRFLKVLVSIPFAFKRMESLLFMSIFQEEISSIKQSFATLEVASKELSNSRLFLKLLEAVLKTGNRMNDGTYRGGAQAFKLDTLLKLSDVKGTDGKTTLLHFVVQEISRSEGLKAARRLKQSLSMSSVKTEDCVEENSRQESAEYYQSLGLQVVSRLSNELENVKKAAIIDRDNLTQSVAKLKHSLSKAKDFLDTDAKNLEEDSEFRETLTNFLEHAGEEIARQLEEEKRIMALVKSTGDYFHGKTGKDEGLRLFVIVRDFLLTLDKVCKEVGELMKPANPTKGESPTSPLQESQNEPLPDIHLQLFPAIKARQVADGFSSDDESPSP